MDTNLVTPGSGGEKDSFIVCRNSQGVEVRASLLRLTRYLVVFEVYNPYSILQLSEVLSEFKIIMTDRLVYSGRAVISNLVNTGIVLVCEANLEDSWLDIDIFSPLQQRQRLQADFSDFLKEWEKIHRVVPDFKVVVADMQTLLMDLRRWLEQVELGVRSSPTGNRLEAEREVLLELRQPVVPAINALFERFEGIAGSIDAELQPVHRSYIKRQIHPLVLCSPFAYRTYQKPLGYAGDYEMVNMILRDPHEGSSLFAKMLNVWFLSQPPAQAHRNRIDYLTQKLVEETERMARQGKMAQIFNLGCGPAKEVQNFLISHDICERANLTLLDFNDETLAHTGKLLDDIKMRYRKVTQIQLVKKSVHQILKEGTRNAGSPDKKYDFLYCAGLFDYLSDRICKRLMNIFYEALAPGGLLVATNVDAGNPIRNMLEYVLEWHLVYRDSNQLASITPDNVTPDQVQTRHDATGVNVYVEVRKPL
jgi:extracellular factor (EF) 3-hydroxypalmitic acid methyl ester biosynthesis protein